MSKIVKLILILAVAYLFNQSIGKVYIGVDNPFKYDNAEHVKVR